MKKSLCLLLILTGCAGYRPIVDTKGVDLNRYEADLKECQQYADQVSPATSTAGGAAAGALLGAAIGALFGNRQSAGQGAAAMGLLGGAQGASHGANAQMGVIRNCMSGRGYRVLQ